MGYIVFAVCGYLLGSISIAIILSKIKYNQDIRNFGSGNAGMTNVLRTYGKADAAIAFAGDFFKGLGAVALARWLAQALPGLSADPEIAGYVAGFFALIGHLFPVFFGMRGGKGVSTAAGIICITNPIVLIMIFIPYVLIIAATRYVSLASIAAGVFYPLFTFIVLSFRGEPVVWRTVYALTVGLIVIFKHRANIGRLIRGEESKIKFK